MKVYALTIDIFGHWVLDSIYSSYDSAVAAGKKLDTLFKFEVETHELHA